MTSSDRGYERSSQHGVVLVTVNENTRLLNRHDGWSVDSP